MLPYSVVSVSYSLAKDLVFEIGSVDASSCVMSCLDEDFFFFGGFPVSPLAVFVSSFSYILTGVQSYLLVAISSAACDERD